MTCRHAVRHLRQQGVKAGMVAAALRSAWPTEDVANILSKFKAVGVIETSTSYGGAMKGGNLWHEVRECRSTSARSARSRLPSWPAWAARWCR